MVLRSALVAMTIWLSTYGSACCEAEDRRSGHGAPERLPVDSLAAALERGLLPGTLIKGEAEPGMELKDRMAYHRVSGVGIAVVDGGRVTWERGYGVLRKGAGDPVVATTLFQAASIGKAVTALTTLILAERGALDLDENVNRLLKSWQLPDNRHTREEPVTVRRILSHTAGLTVHGFGGYTPEQPLPSVLEILDGTGPANNQPVRVEIPPGSRFRYSGGGYVVLQQICEDVTGRGFSDLVRELVFEPLRMDNSLYAGQLQGELASRAAVAHDDEGQPLPGRWQVYPEFGAGAGLWTTAGDLAHFVVGVQRSIAGNGVLGPEMAKEMITPQPVEQGPQVMALGLVVGEGSGHTWFQHGGQNVGYLCRMIGFARGGRGAVVMTNGEGGGDLCDEIIQGIASIYDWPAFGPKEIEVATVDPTILAQLPGSYHSEAFPEFHLVVSLTEGRPVLVIVEAGIELNLLAVSDWEYFAREAPASLSFVRDEHGIVTGFEFSSETLPSFAAQRVQ